VLALVCSACPAPTPVGTGRQINTNPTAERLTQNVVLVIIDGLRYSEGLGDPDHVYVPRMAELAGWGARVDPFLNNGVTVTRRGIPAIWCGTWDAPVLFDDPACGGSTNQRTVAPSIFEYYRKSLDRPADDCVYVLGSVLCPWRQSLHPDYGETYWPRVDQVGDNDIGNWEQARAVLQNDKPHFLLLYLPDVDHFGHYGDWPGYTRAIAVADSIVGMLWDTLQADPQYAGRTTLFVTNDHGRHNNRPDEPHDGFSGHGDDCAGCRRIELLAVGPDIRPGFRSTTPRNIPDIAPTIGALLGFPTPFVTGSVMTEILTDAPPGE
jgi:hypothetical protein